VNGDGLYDQLDFQLSMYLEDTEQVTSVQLMLFFSYVLQVTYLQSFHLLLRATLHCDYIATITLHFINTDSL